MAVAAERLGVARTMPREVWLTFCWSVGLHLVLLVLVVVMPRFPFGRYVTIPVTYSVNLVDASAIAGRGPGGVTAPRPASPAPPPAAPALRPAAPAAPAPRVAPPAPDELTLPERRSARPRDAEPPVRPTPAPPAPTPPAPRPAPRPTPAVPALPAMPSLPQAPPPLPDARPAPPAIASLPQTPSPSASIGPAPPVARPGPGAGAGEAKSAGVEVAGTSEGLGGTTLGYYLTLVDRKIQDNWVPLGAGTTPVLVRFRVLRSGQVRDVELEQGSGDSAADTSALRAIRQSMPLPPFPNLLSESSLDLRYRFVAER